MDGTSSIVQFPVLSRDPQHTSQNRALCANWLTWCDVRRGLSKTTLQSYSKLILHYAAFLDELGVGAATAERVHMEAFLARPRKLTQDPSPGTLHREATTLKSFYNWLRVEGYVERSVAEGLITPRRPGRQPKPVADDVWRRVWAYNWPDEIRTVLGLGYFIGLRRAELFNLRLDQIEDDTIWSFIRKGGGEHTLKFSNYLDVYQHVEQLRPLVISTELLTEAIKRRKASGDTWLVKGRENIQEPEAINKRFMRWCRRAGVPAITPHQLRHSAATNLARGGVPPHLIMAMLNHGNIEITMTYIRTTGADMDEWLQNRFQ